MAVWRDIYKYIHGGIFPPALVITYGGLTAGTPADYPGPHCPCGLGEFEVEHVPAALYGGHSLQSPAFVPVMVGVLESPFRLSLVQLDQ